MHTWHWQTWEGCSYLTCSLLSPWPHGFFTHQFWPRSPGDLTPALHPTAEVYRVKQVHGNTVFSTEEIKAIAPTDPDPVLQEADGIVTTAPNQAAWVCTADCTPVLIADARTGQVSAVHAGWRGTAAEIVPQAIARLQAQGSQLADLCFVMGPAIAGQVYQVDAQVAATVGATVMSGGIQARDADIEGAIATLQQFTNPPVFPDPEPDKARLDVRRVNALQLELLGVQPEKIAIAPFCTYQQPEYFFSYRRDQQKKVQWSGIVSTYV